MGSNGAHAATSRPPIKIVTAEQEEAGNELKLGEFQNTPTLSLSEARIIINAVIDQRHANKKRFTETEVLTKMTEYLDTFARFRRKETIEEIDELLRAHAVFDPFEKSQLATLCCENHEEAKYLIPSIANKISDVELQELLDEISKRRNFVE